MGPEVYERQRGPSHAVEDESAKAHATTHGPSRARTRVRVISGHSRYFAVPGMGARVQVLPFQVGRAAGIARCRRSQAKGTEAGSACIGSSNTRLPLSWVAILTV